MENYKSLELDLIMNSTKHWNKILEPYRVRDTSKTLQIEDVLEYCIDNKVLLSDVKNHLTSNNVDFTKNTLLQSINISLRCVDVEQVTGGKNKRYLTNITLVEPRLKMSGLPDDVIDVVYEVRNLKLKQGMLSGMSPAASLLLLSGESIALGQEIKYCYEKEKDLKKYFYSIFNRYTYKGESNDRYCISMKRAIINAHSEFESLRKYKEFYPDVSENGTAYCLNPTVPIKYHQAFKEDNLLPYSENSQKLLG